MDDAEEEKNEDGVPSQRMQGKVFVGRQRWPLAPQKALPPPFVHAFVWQVGSSGTKLEVDEKPNELRKDEPGWDDTGEENEEGGKEDCCEEKTEDDCDDAREDDELPKQVIQGKPEMTAQRSPIL